METSSMDRLLSTQSKLFEVAHSESMELKPLGYKIKAEGINTEKYYCNPDFLMLPFSGCETLAGMSETQKSILSAIFFSHSYAEIASSETLALTYNMSVAKKVFDIYSDEYMVLFHETAEETDHIITFRSVCKGLLGRVDLVGPANYSHLKPIYSAFEAFESRLCDYGYGAMYLFMRYLLNLALKQLESFMDKGVEDEKRHDIAHAIIVGHATDEARHTTTSLQLGYEFYKKATPFSRSIVKRLLKQSINTMIDMRYGNPYRQYQHQLSKRVLAEALSRPEFDDIKHSVDDLNKIWENENLSISLSSEYVSSQRWLTQQVFRLTEMLELKLKPRNENFEEFFQFKNEKVAKAHML